MYCTWSDEEDKILVDNWKQCAYKELLLLLPNKTEAAVANRKRYFKLPPKLKVISLNRPWSQDEDSIIITNPTLNCNELTSLFTERTRPAIERRRRALIKQGKVPSYAKSSHQVWTEREQQILKDNYYKIEHKDLVGLLPGRTRKAIIMQAKQVLGLSEDKRHQRTYFVDKDFFKIPNIINCYFAGYIAADGCLTERKNLFSIGLGRKDKHILEEFVYHIKYEGSIIDTITDGGKYKKSSLYIWGVPEWLADLKTHFNITPRKSLTLLPPNLEDKHLIKAYIKGLVDGDGSIMPTCGLNKWKLDICGTEEVLLFIQNLFDMWVPNKIYKKSEVRRHSKNSKIFRYSISGKRSIQILKLLCEVPTPELTRKWSPFRTEFGILREPNSPFNYSST